MTTETIQRCPQCNSDNKALYGLGCIHPKGVNVWHYTEAAVPASPVTAQICARCGNCAANPWHHAGDGEYDHDFVPQPTTKRVAAPVSGPDVALETAKRIIGFFMFDTSVDQPFNVENIAALIRTALEEQVQELRKTNRELNRRNGALQHTINTMTDRSIWYGYYKAAMSLFGWEEYARKKAESETRQLREALWEGLLLAILLRTFCDLKEPLDKNAAEKMGAFMRKAERVLNQK